MISTNETLVFKTSLFNLIDFYYGTISAPWGKCQVFTQVVDAT